MEEDGTGTPSAKPASFLSPDGLMQADGSFKAGHTLLSTPSLRYIPDSVPHPPTYPAPSPMAPTGKRKRKKSGLAKLLAENRERQEATKVGSWGLA